MASTGLLLIILSLPLILIYAMRKGLLGKSEIPERRSTPNCNIESRWCTCQNGESWKMNPSHTCKDCEVECYDRMGGTGRFVTDAGIQEGDITGYSPSGYTGPIPIKENLVQGTLQFPLSDKVAIPIIGSTMNWNKREFSSNFAYGICKCDDGSCCYKAPYKAERGDIKTANACHPLYFGDKVRACDNAFLNWQDDMFESGIDENAYINRKVGDRRFFYPLGDGNSHNRHAYSGKRMPEEYLYMDTGAHRPYNQRAFPAMMYNNILKSKKHALKQITREKVRSKGLKYGRLARKMI